MTICSYLEEWPETAANFIGSVALAYCWKSFWEWGLWSGLSLGWLSPARFGLDWMPDDVGLNLADR